MPSLLAAPTSTSDGRDPSPASSMRTTGTETHASSAVPSSSRLEAVTSASRRRSSSRHTDQSRPVVNSHLVTLWTHDPPNFSTNEIVIGSDVLKAVGNVGENELIEVSLPPGVRPKAQTNGNDNSTFGGLKATARGAASRKLQREPFVFRLSQKAPESDAATRSGQLQLSLSRSIANMYGFSNRQEVLISKVPRSKSIISHVELYFRDQYVGRADMWRITEMLEDTCVYVGQKITFASSVRATVGRIFIKERKVGSGYVSADSKAIFRSESAKYHLFFQLGKEMWDFDEDGEIYYEKALTGFIPELLRRWRAVPTNHVLSIILFARVWYDESEVHILEEAALPVRKEEDGSRFYVDYYKVVVDLESNSDWKDVMSMLKEEFFRFQHDILLIGRPVAGPAGAPSREEEHADLLRRDHTLLAGRVSASHEGNILEAVNLALNPFDEHYIDRDLNRTGLDLVIITAGTGHFRVNKKWLRMTTERMIDNGIGLDLICLTKMPLHSVPLFRFTSSIPEAASSTADAARGQRKAGRGASGGRPQSAPPDPLYFDSLTSPKDLRSHLFEPSVEFFSIPHWIDASFYNLQQDKPFRADRFVPRVKMQEIQQIGYMESEISDISLPYLDLRPLAAATTGLSAPGARSLSVGAGTGSSDGGGIGQGGVSNGLEGLASREQRRALRERFDREMMRDLDTAPASARSQALLASGSGFHLSGINLPGLRNNSYDSQEGPLGERSTSRGPRGNRKGRDSLRVKPALESHAEDGAESMTSSGILPDGQSNELVESPGPMRHQRDSTYSTATNSPDLSVTAYDDSYFRRISRAGSIRSVATSSRGLRPLQPIGKAEAFVAASGSDDLMNELEEAAANSQEVPSVDSPATQAARQSLHAYTLSGSPARQEQGSRFSPGWLWSSLTGHKRTASSSEAVDRSASSDAASPSAVTSVASLRIKAILRNSPSHRELRLQSNAAGRRVVSDRTGMLTRADGGAPKPVSIPAAHVAPSPSTPRKESYRSSGSGSVGARGVNDARFQQEQDAYEQALEEEEAKARYAQRAQVEKQTLVNPSNPCKNLNTNPVTSQLLRWQHLFPRRLNRHVVKWRSMTTPACLPLTTFYLPTELELHEQWYEYTNTLPVSSELSSFLVKRSSSQAPALSALRELTSQRLAQGFQFIVPMEGPASRKAGEQNRAVSSRRFGTQSKNAKFTLHHPSELFQPGILSSGHPILLGMSNQIHRISYDRAAGAINIQRFIRKMPYDTAAIEYSCCIWARHLPGYQTIKSTLKYPAFGSYDWTYLDSLVAGHADEDKLTEDLRYWRTRFVIVPSEGHPPPMTAPTGEKLDDEEIRLIGMDRLADLFSRARWRGGRGSKSADGSQAAALLRFIPTSLDPSMSMWDEDFMRQMESAIVEDEQVEEALRTQRASARAKKYIKDASLDNIAAAMGSEKGGLKIDNRLWNRTMYSATFTGMDLTTWLFFEYGDVNSRDEAVEWGARLMSQGLFEHVHEVHGFLDGHYFYRLKGEYAKKAQASKTRSASVSGEKPAARPEQPGGRNVATAHRGSAATAANSKTTHLGTSKKSVVPRRMKMSRSLIINVDPSSRSDRAETAFLHYDISHNPANGFNAQLHWLGTTARFIEDTVQNWTRTVERYGLRLIEAPIGQICDVSKHNPFQAPCPIHLSLPPPPPSSYIHLLPPHSNPKEYFEWALLRKFGFVLDQEAADRYPSEVQIIYQSRPNRFDYSQFVHRSGVAFVQVKEAAKGFLWLTNRLFNSHVGSQTGPASGGGAAQRGSHHGHGSGTGGGDQRGRRARSPPPHSSSGAAKCGNGRTSAESTLPNPDETRKQFQSFCSDPAALQDFYLEVLGNLQRSAVAIATGDDVDEDEDEVASVGATGDKSGERGHENHAPSVARLRSNHSRNPSTEDHDMDRHHRGRRSHRERESTVRPADGNGDGGGDQDGRSGSAGTASTARTTTTTTAKRSLSRIRNAMGLGIGTTGTA